MSVWGSWRELEDDRPLVASLWNYVFIATRGRVVLPPWELGPAAAALAPHRGWSANIV